MFVKVKYEIRNQGQRSSGTRTSASLQVAAKTESAVMDALRRRHPGKEIILLSIE